MKSNSVVVKGYGPGFKLREEFWLTVAEPPDYETMPLRVDPLAVVGAKALEFVRAGLVVTIGPLR